MKMNLQMIEESLTQPESVESLLDQYADRVNHQLKEKLPQETDSPKTLHKAIYCVRNVH